MKGIWITWEIQRRNRGISSALGWPLYEITYSGSRFQRYLYSSVKTIQCIFKEKPQIVAAQNPSIVLAALVILLKYFLFLSFKVVIDAHNSGIYPMEGKNHILMAVSRWLQRFTDLTIVTNEQLQSIVEANSGRAFVLPDRLTDEIPKVKLFPVKGKVNIAFICTYSVDEPYQEVIQAAKILPSDVMIYITGKYKGKVTESQVPENVKLLGFISEEDFWALLSSVDYIMDLTLREGCLVCGAYEGVALSKPLILSDTQTLRSYFSKGCVYVKPTAESIAAGIQIIIKDRTVFESDIKELKESLTTSWNEAFQGFNQILTTL